MNSGYAERAAFYAVETQGLRAPALLDDHVHTGTQVAEAPSGAGHHLVDYARLGAIPTLLDAEPAMVAAARRNLEATGVAGEVLRHRIGTDQLTRRFPVAVCPNGALNQLAASIGLETALHGLVELLEPGGVLIAHVLLRNDDDTIDIAPCYDPEAAHDSWLHEWTRPDGHGGTLTRLRRQHRENSDLHIKFRRLRNGDDLGYSTVHLRLLTAGSLENGPWRLTAVTSRPHGMSEIALRKETRT